MDRGDTWKDLGRSFVNFEGRQPLFPGRNSRPVIRLTVSHLLGPSNSVERPTLIKEI